MSIAYVTMLLYRQSLDGTASPSRLHDGVSCSVSPLSIGSIHLQNYICRYSLNDCDQKLIFSLCYSCRYSYADVTQGLAKIFSLEVWSPRSNRLRPDGLKIEAAAGRERLWGSWGGAASFSTARGLREECKLKQWGSGRPKGFHHFQHSGWPLLTL